MSTSPEPTVDVQLTSSVDIDWLNLQRLADLLESAAKSLELRGELGIRLATDEEMTALHSQFMGIVEPTDVITFPGDDFEPEYYLGDIAVSIEIAAEQAVDAGHVVAREVAFLCLHGLLHLAGYNDQEPDERERMLAEQEELLNAFERHNPGEWERAAER